jgi:hypothetical protein
MRVFKGHFFVSVVGAVLMTVTTVAGAWALSVPVEKALLAISG